MNKSWLSVFHPYTFLKNNLFKRKKVIMSKYNWLLDNGHGGMINGKYQTKGKRSPVYDGRQIFEGVYNREIVDIVHRYLKSNAIDSSILVPEQEDISLRERVRRVNETYKHKPNTILVSFHLNLGGGTGFEVYTSKGETFSDKFATMFAQYWQQNTDFVVRTDYSDGGPDKEANFYILKYTYCPAILVESLFMDNKNDFDYLISKEGKHKIAENHINSILNCEKYL